MRFRATDRAEESQWWSDWEPLALSAGLLGAGESCLLPHVVGAGLNPDGVVDDPVHDRVRVDAGAEPLVARSRPRSWAHGSWRVSVPACNE